MNADFLLGLPARWRETGEGVVSICSAHPWVIEVSLATEGAGPVLIEATCNQVNQEGGYTGMTPIDFRRFVERIAKSVGFDPSRLVFGGDHLGPNPWKHLPAEAAMDRAEAMVAAYVEAGFSKLHLDASMGCLNEPVALDDEVAAARAARLARVAEAAARQHKQALPVYVVGTEVPTPGGATHALDAIEVTRPEAALASLTAHRVAFASEGIADAFDRVIAVVVQPGVEFDHERIASYQPAAAKNLTAVLAAENAIVFEAHSTDYQPPALLKEMVKDGFAILKVGPALTFALREALYGLDHIAAEISPAWRERSLEAAMERLMIADPSHWQRYYRGTPSEQRHLRHFSCSDRIRYYWPTTEAKQAVARLMKELEPAELPESLVRRFLPRSLAGDPPFPKHPRTLVLAAIRQVLDDYISATRGDSERRIASREGARR